MTFDRIAFDQDKRRLLTEQAADTALFDLGRDFVVASDRHGYAYQWTWCSLPIIQMPQDVLAIQQIMWAHKPTVVIETGVAWGGGIALYASLMDLYGGRLVIGVDLNLSDSVVQAVSSLEFSTRIELLKGSSTDARVVSRLRESILHDDRVMVVLDSNHTHDHVLAELRALASLVTVGQYLIVSDTIVEDIPVQTHRPRPWGPGNNPKTAVREFLSGDERFAVDEHIDNQLVLSYCVGGYLTRKH